MDNKPYIVSADIYLLLKKWAKSKNLTLPEKEFFQRLRKEFSVYMLGIFPGFELISEEEIFEYLSQVAFESKLPILSLDPVYLAGDYSLELTRTVSVDGTDQGLRHRFGSCTLSRQLFQIQQSGIKEVCLVDDVIFSGVLVERIIKLLASIGVSVRTICAGVGIGEGIHRISSLNHNVYCLKTYDAVIDEVCERDFYLGIPYSGRSFTNGKNIGMPYLLPFGNPEKWASVPAALQNSFSEFCIKQSITLFEEIEEASGKVICCSEIERMVFNQPEKGRYVDFLKEIRV